VPLSSAASTASSRSYRLCPARSAAAEAAASPDSAPGMSASQRGRHSLRMAGAHTNLVHRTHLVGARRQNLFIVFCRSPAVPGDDDALRPCKHLCSTDMTGAQLSRCT